MNHLYLKKNPKEDRDGKQYTKTPLLKLAGGL